MDQLGLLLRTTRETMEVSIEEACKDLDLKEFVITNIEEGNIGCFKDIFELKEDLKKYAKYLGLDPEKIIDEFNEYLFEYTSKIPVKDIEKAVVEINKKEKSEKKIVSPYTSPQKTKKELYYTIVYILVIIMVIVLVVWAVNQIIVK